MAPATSVMYVHMIIRSVHLDWQSILSLALVAGFFALALTL